MPTAPATAAAVPTTVVVTALACFCNQLFSLVFCIISKKLDYKEVKKFSIPLLGSFPLDPEIQRASDLGVPLPLTNKDNPAVLLYGEIAKKLLTL